MPFAKVSYTASEYAGESFTKEVAKQDNSEWASNESGLYEMYDTGGSLVSHGDAVKTSDNLKLVFTVPATDTASFTGSYLLLFYLTDSNDANIKDVVVEYVITYKAKQGPA